MAKTHEYVLVSAEGACSIRKSNGPICFQQSRQEVGGHFEAFDPQLGDQYTAQVNDGGNRHSLRPNVVFEGVAGNVLIGRVHGAEMWGLSEEQRTDVLAQLGQRPRISNP